LEKGTQLGAKDFIRLEREDLGAGLMPVALDGERVRLEAMAASMLPRIDFDL
jgi:hypothetical protein